MITPLLISASKVAQVQAVIAKINRKAARFGFDPFVFRITGTQRLKALDLGDPYGVMQVPAVPVEIEGEFFRFGHFKLMAEVKYGSDDMLESSREYEDFRLPPADLLNKKQCCDHCNVARARNHYFYVKDQQDPAGTITRIGSTCVEDVLGYSPATVASFAQLIHEALAIIAGMEAEGDILASMRDSDGVNKDASAGTATAEAFALSLEVITAHGYVSNTKSQEMLQDGVVELATGQRVYQAIQARQKPSEAHLEMAQAHLDLEKARYEQCCKDNQPLDLFDAKVLSTLLSDTITADRLSFIAYAASSCLRAARERVIAAISEPVGTVGESLDIDLRLRFQHSFSNQFGIKYILNMEDEKGNQVTWFTTNPQGLRLGDVVRLSAKVDKQEAYKGTMQTTISRPSIHAVLTRDEYEGEWPGESEWVKGLGVSLLAEAESLNLAAVKRLQGMGADVLQLREEAPGEWMSALDLAAYSVLSSGDSMGQQGKSVQSLIKHLVKSGARLMDEWEADSLVKLGLGEIGIKLESVRAANPTRANTDNEFSPAC